MDSLSKRQQQIYNFIESYIEQKGFGPTVREICEAVNLSSRIRATSCVIP